METVLLSLWEGVAMIKSQQNEDENATTISKSDLAYLLGQIEAINKFQSSAEYSMDGKFTSVNEKYQSLTGYSANELIGQDLDVLLDLQSRYSPEYKDFWERLNRGECISGQFKRIAKDVKTVWIHATYFPMMDLSGKPFKVVEYATDVTEHVQLKQALASTVKQVHDVVLAVKNGDFTQMIPLEGKEGEIAMLCNDVNSLIDCVTAIIRLINNAGDFIINAANKVKAANKALSQRWSHQAIQSGTVSSLVAPASGV